MKNLKIRIAIILSFFSSLSWGQDIQFSQFYTVPMYQNPAFAGSSHHGRAMFHQRLQWPRLDGKYITSLAAFDTYFSKYRSGVGLMVFKDWQGSGTINSLDISLNYAYEVYLSSNLTFRPGLSVSFVNRNIDYAQLRFPSQHNDTIGFTGAPSPVMGMGTPNVMYPDVASGGIFYTDRIWFGISAHHLNLPNQSFIKDVSRLPVKVAFTGGYKIMLQEKRSSAYIDQGREVTITPTFHYKFQGTSDQLDLGIYGMYGEYIVGFWYRGLPIKHYREGIQNNESMIFLAGWKVKNFAVTYSYDVTISKLSSARTGGSHELNLTYFHSKIHKKKKPMKRLPCPQFYKHH